MRRPFTLPAWLHAVLCVKFATLSAMQSQDRQRSRPKHHHHDVATSPAAVGSPSQILLQQQKEQIAHMTRYFERTHRQIEEECV